LYNAPICAASNTPSPFFCWLLLLHGPAPAVTFPHWGKAGTGGRLHQVLGVALRGGRLGVEAGGNGIALGFPHL